MFFTWALTTHDAVTIIEYTVAIVPAPMIVSIVIMPLACGDAAILIEVAIVVTPHYVWVVISIVVHTFLVTDVHGPVRSPHLKTESRLCRHCSCEQE